MTRAVPWDGSVGAADVDAAASAGVIGLPAVRIAPDEAFEAYAKARAAYQGGRSGRRAHTQTRVLILDVAPRATCVRCRRVHVIDDRLSRHACRKQ